MTAYYCSKCGVTWLGSDGWAQNRSGAIFCTACTRAERAVDPDEWPMGRTSTSSIQHPEYTKQGIRLFRGGQPGTGRKAR